MHWDKPQEQFLDERRHDLYEESGLGKGDESGIPGFVGLRFVASKTHAIVFFRVPD